MTNDVSLGDSQKNDEEDGHQIIGHSVIGASRPAARIHRRASCALRLLPNDDQIQAIMEATGAVICFIFFRLASNVEATKCCYGVFLDLAAGRRKVIPASLKCPGFSVFARERRGRSA